MKKSLFMLGLAVAAMTSCTNDEVVDVKQPTQHAIGFESFVNKGTRAVTETTTPNLDDNNAVTGLSQFYVFGYYGTNTEVFGNILVKGEAGTETTGNDGIVWKYATNDADLKYWTKNKYQFAAYANKNQSGKIDDTDFSNGTLTFTDYTVSDTEDLVADVVEKDNSNYGAYNSKVGFDFKHLLTKIYFEIKNTDATYRMKVTSPLTITGVKNQGTATLIEDGTLEWTPTTSGTTRDNFVPVVADETSITNDIFEASSGVWKSQEYFVMPQNVAGIKFSITADFIDANDEVVATKTLTNKDFTTTVSNWDEGYVYCYTISLPIAAKPIEFDVTSVGGWTNYSNSIELNPNDYD